MQKLSVKLKNAPGNAPQVPCSVSSVLNRDESLSVQDKVRADNNLEVDQSIHIKSPLKTLVYVISKTGKPLMPCTPAKANRMLKKGAASVVRRRPFTIKLNFDCDEIVQDIKCGIDSGYKHIGFSCISEKRELISGELELDDKTSERLTERRMYRRGRRNKLWYRESRFLNRAIPKGWLPPSIQRRYDTHLNLIRRLKNLLPISEVIVEVGNFDIQKIKNPEISGVGYQQGSLYEYQNVKSFLISREYGKCQLCNKKYDKDNNWHVHHIIPKSKGGTNIVDNLALLHEKCHDKIHKQNLLHLLKKNKQYKESTFMSIIKNRFVKDLNCKLVFGYQTFLKRIRLGLSKEHFNDAFCISGGELQERCKPFDVIQKHRNNRVLQLNRKGFKSGIRKKRYDIQPLDSVWIKGKEYIAKGVHCEGRRIVVEGMGSITIKLIEKYFRNNWRWAILSNPEGLGFLA
jgi:5-methylcytosine-specific restriction endonuclease McrA